MIKKYKIFLIIFSIIAGLSVLIGLYFSLFYKHPLLSNKQASATDDKEFAAYKTEKEKLPIKNNEVSLIAVGDVMLSRAVDQKMQKNGFDYPFQKIAGVLKSADLVFGNLETSITPGKQVNTDDMSFRADPKVAQALKDANFSIVSLANNHTPNFGQKGLLDTFSYLKGAGIAYAGAGQDDAEAFQPVILESKGIKFAFLAYNDSDVVPPLYQAAANRAGTAFMDIDTMANAVKEAKKKADFVIVSMHSGTEYTPAPNKRQTDFAHAAITAGAETVIGHHPHVVQTMEKYQGKYIFYSLGNFIFDQMWSLETRQGMMLKMFFTKSGLVKTEFLPVVIQDYSQPVIAEGADATDILDRLDYDLNDLPNYF